MQPIYDTPLGKPKKKTHEAPPLHVPDEQPATMPAPKEPVKVPVPA